MTSRRKRVYEISLIICCLIIIGLSAYMGITAVQKSMRLNVGFPVSPAIKCQIDIKANGANDNTYTTIFNNNGEDIIGTGIELSGNMLKFTETFANAYATTLGGSFVLKITNLMTDSGIKVSASGTGATSNPTYVTMKASGTGLNTATMTISGNSALATLQLMFSEYNVYTASFSGPSVSNATAEVGSGDAYSTTLTPKEGYNIPSSVTITVGGVAIDSNSYSYDPNTDALTIYTGVVNGDVVITAAATAKSYTITYNLAGGTNHPSNPATYTVEDTITLQAPTRLFYEFTGWTGSNGSTPQTSVIISQGSTGNKTYTANWTLGNYTLMKGENLNVVIKTELGYSSPGYYTLDSTVKSIRFGKYSDYSSTVGAWTGGIAVDSNSAGNIRMFLINSNANCYILSDGNIYANAESTGSNVYNYMFYGFTDVTSFTFNNFNTSNVKNMRSMFMNCSSLTSLTLGSNFNTSNVTDMSYMFCGCYSLTELDLSSFNTSKVTHMTNMFSSCSGLTCIGLTSLNLSNFDTSKVTHMNSMFSGCSGLTSLDLSNFNTANVTNMSSMFDGCSGLTSLDLSTFNTSKVTTMAYMFWNCSGLTSLNLNSFNTSKVTWMERMFCDCSSLTELDLSTFNTSNVTNMARMFQSCSNLTTIYVSTLWSTAKVTGGIGSTSSTFMFSGCTSLVGGNGKKYSSSSYTDKTYARIDTAETPGYLTLKT